MAKPVNIIVPDAVPAPTQVYSAKERTMPAEMSGPRTTAQQMNEVIEALEGLSDRQRQFLRQRWLDQAVWMDGKAVHAQRRYYFWRLLVVVGGVTVPALVSLSGPSVVVVASPAAWIVSLIVAISATIEAFFHYGDRWHQYRRTAELLKTEGWQFFQLSGAYRTFSTHADAYREFATRVEEVIQRDVEVFITETAQKGPDGSRGGTSAGDQSGN